MDNTPVRIVSNSMAPYFRSGDHAVIDFSKSSCTLGSIAVFYNDQKELVMHRVFKESASTVVVKGDAAIAYQVVLKDQLIGYVSGRQRGECITAVSRNSHLARGIARVSMLRLSGHLPLRLLSRLAVNVLSRLQ